MAEHISRLPIANWAWPDKKLFFTIPVGLTQDSLPSYLWDILAWYDVPRDRVEIINEPTHVGRLFACEQGETLPNIGPSSAYLDLIEAASARHNLPEAGNGVTYVGRMGQLAKGNGGHLGETYLVSLLADLGVTIVDPDQAGFTSQMHSYAGAETLIFAEGSAMHGRQAFGQRAQNIHVLRRRQNRFMAQVQLAPRVAALTYHNTAGSEMIPNYGNGALRVDQGAVIYNLDNLFSIFDKLGLALSSIWDEDAYQKTVIHDAIVWFKTHDLNPKQMLASLDTLENAGINLDDAPFSETIFPLETADTLH
jgi:hypothetical protein